MGRFYYVFLLLIAFFLMVIYDLYDSFLLSVMLLLSPFCLYFFSRKAGRSVSFACEAPSSVERGKEAEIAISLKSPFLPFLSSPEVRLSGLY